MNLDPTQPRKRERASTVVDQIYGDLRTRVLRGGLLPGARLVELDLAAQTGASQASVREALQRLEGDGLVVRRGRAGTFVTEVSAAEIHEILLIRGMVESFAIRHTVRAIRPEQIDELWSLVRAMRDAAGRGDLVATVERDMAFHQRICAWADHPTLLRVWTLLYTQLERFLVMHGAQHFTDLVQVADSHLPILEALARGDPAAAAEQILGHVQHVVHAAVREAGPPEPGRSP